MHYTSFFATFDKICAVLKGQVIGNDMVRYIIAFIEIHRNECPFPIHSSYSVASPGSGARLGAREAQNYMKLFVVHKMMRNNTPNKVHVAATELLRC